MRDLFRRLVARLAGRARPSSPPFTIANGSCTGGLPFDPDHPDAWHRYAAERAELLERFRNATPGRPVFVSDPFRNETKVKPGGPGYTDDLTRLVPRDGQSWEDFAAERAALLDLYLGTDPDRLVVVGDYYYDWSNPEDRPSMRAALGRFAPDGPVFGGDR